MTLKSTARTVFALLASLVLVVAACGGSDPETGDGGADNGVVDDGGSDGDSNGGGGVGTEDALEQAATDMFLAFTTGDHQTYFNYLSADCRDLGFSSVDGHLDGRKFRADGAGIDVRSLGVDSVDISGFSGDSAFVALNLSGTTELFQESIDNSWIYEDGDWHLDQCSDITPAQGGLEGYGTNRDEPIPYGGVADIGGWLMTVSWIAPDDEELVVEFGGQPPAEGSQLFNITLNPFYNGADATVLGEDLAFAMVFESTVYGEEADCGGTDPVFLDPATEASPGDDFAPMYLCREIPAEHAIGMLLRITDLATGTDYWFDLTPPE